MHRLQSMLETDTNSLTDEKMHVILNYLHEIRALRENIRRCDLYLKNAKKNEEKLSFKQNQRPKRKIKTKYTSNSECLQQRLEKLNYEMLTFRNGLKLDNSNQKIKMNYTQFDDLINLQSPLTEDAIIRILFARYTNSNYNTMIGPILISINPHSSFNQPHSCKLLGVIQSMINYQFDTGLTQALIFNGSSGSGKTTNSLTALRYLFESAGGGCQTDAFKRLVASLTVLRCFGSAKTLLNSESSRTGHFIEVQMTNGAISRTKIHCLFLDQARIVGPLPKEKNYHIFYQMLAGLTMDEKIKLNLNGYSIQDFNYLANNCIVYTNEKEDSSRFETWKASLAVLGIPFFDVVRVLAAILLLGNIHFIQTNDNEVEVQGNNEIQAIATLLGITSSSLFRSLISQSRKVNGKFIKSICDANTSNSIRDSLAKALYCRTVATIVRRANSLKTDTDKTRIKCATGGFIGILDMFGFENGKSKRLEHLCINLCAEAMQQFYNKHIFKNSIEKCKNEGIKYNFDIQYEDNTYCINLISSIFKILDSECSNVGTNEKLIHKMKLQHTNNHIFVLKSNEFAIQHFAGKVIYNIQQFINTNKTRINQSVVAIFHKDNCNFGFVTHLFNKELELISKDGQSSIAFRIGPTSSIDLQSNNRNKQIATLTHDFHTRIDNLLKILVNAQPHFVMCIKANDSQLENTFDRDVVMQQIRAFQVLETVNLMACGYTYIINIKLFIIKYKCLVPFKSMRENDINNCKFILNHLSDISWIVGNKHVFLTESARQQIETQRNNKRQTSAKLIQITWRNWYFDKNPKPQEFQKCDQELIQRIFQLNWQKAPKIPPSRPYTIVGNLKLCYPQKRIMATSYRDDSNGSKLSKGAAILVVGTSQQRGHLLINHQNDMYNVPHQFTHLLFN